MARLPQPPQERIAPEDGPRSLIPPEQQIVKSLDALQQRVSSDAQKVQNLEYQTEEQAKSQTRQFDERVKHQVRQNEENVRTKQRELQLLDQHHNQELADLMARQDAQALASKSILEFNASSRNHYEEIRNNPADFSGQTDRLVKRLDEEIEAIRQTFPRTPNGKLVGWAHDTVVKMEDVKRLYEGKSIELEFTLRNKDAENLAGARTQDIQEQLLQRISNDDDIVNVPNEDIVVNLDHASREYRGLLEDQMSAGLILPSGAALAQRGFEEASAINIIERLEASGKHQQALELLYGRDQPTNDHRALQAAYSDLGIAPVYQPPGPLDVPPAADFAENISPENRSKLLQRIRTTVESENVEDLERTFRVDPSNVSTRDIQNRVGLDPLEGGIDQKQANQLTHLWNQSNSKELEQAQLLLRAARGGRSGRDQPGYRPLDPSNPKDRKAVNAMWKVRGGTQFSELDWSKPETIEEFKTATTAFVAEHGIIPKDVQETIEGRLRDNVDALQTVKLALLTKQLLGAADPRAEAADYSAKFAEVPRFVEHLLSRWNSDRSGGEGNKAERASEAVRYARETLKTERENQAQRQVEGPGSGQPAGKTASSVRRKGPSIEQELTQQLPQIAEDIPLPLVDQWTTSIWQQMKSVLGDNATIGDLLENSKPPSPEFIAAWAENYAALQRSGTYGETADAEFRMKQEALRNTFQDFGPSSINLPPVDQQKRVYRGLAENVASRGHQFNEAAEEALGEQNWSALVSGPKWDKWQELSTDYRQGSYAKEFEIVRHPVERFLQPVPGVPFSDWVTYAADRAIRQTVGFSPEQYASAGQDYDPDLTPYQRGQRELAELERGRAWPGPQDETWEIARANRQLADSKRRAAGSPFEHSAWGFIQDLGERTWHRLEMAVAEAVPDPPDWDVNGKREAEGFWQALRALQNWRRPLPPPEDATPWEQTQHAIRTLVYSAGTGANLTGRSWKPGREDTYNFWEENFQSTEPGSMPTTEQRSQQSVIGRALTGGQGFTRTPQKTIHVSDRISQDGKPLFNIAVMVDGQRQWMLDPAGQLRQFDLDPAQDPVLGPTMERNKRKVARPEREEQVKGAFYDQGRRDQLSSEAQEAIVASQEFPAMSRNEVIKAIARDPSLALKMIRENNASLYGHLPVEIPAGVPGRKTLEEQAVEEEYRRSIPHWVWGRIEAYRKSSATRVGKEKQRLRTEHSDRAQTKAANARTAEEKRAKRAAAADAHRKKHGINLDGSIDWAKRKQ